MRLVLDTNTVVSGLIWGGAPGRLIDAAAAGKALIIASVPLLDELQGVLSRQKFADKLSKMNSNADDLFDGYAALVRLGHVVAARELTSSQYHPPQMTERTL